MEGFVGRWEGGMEGRRDGEREGGREEGARDAASTVLVFYFYAAKNNILWADTIGYHFTANQLAVLVCNASDPRFVGTQ